jgi:hypothetical protein
MIPDSTASVARREALAKFGRRGESRARTKAAVRGRHDSSVLTYKEAFLWPREAGVGHSFLISLLAMSASRPAYVNQPRGPARLVLRLPLAPSADGLGNPPPRSAG